MACVAASRTYPPFAEQPPSSISATATTSTTSPAAVFLAFVADSVSGKAVSVIPTVVSATAIGATSINATATDIPVPTRDTTPFSITSASTYVTTAWTVAASIPAVSAITNTIFSNITNSAKAIISTTHYTPPAAATVYTSTVIASTSCSISEPAATKYTVATRASAPTAVGATTVAVPATTAAKCTATTSAAAPTAVGATTVAVPASSPSTNYEPAVTSTYHYVPPGAATTIIATAIFAAFTHTPSRATPTSSLITITTVSPPSGSTSSRATTSYTSTMSATFFPTATRAISAVFAAAAVATPVYGISTSLPAACHVSSCFSTLHTPAIFAAHSASEP
ncbi:hypothetical protein AB1Y20_015644 [Prymnesium parvum]|uniref:Uncharacterized protein n=1 Tax=Prymnesium parvum TaxID=97485 RepID=A0AB34JZ48_PRYPA